MLINRFLDNHPELSHCQRSEFADDGYTGDVYKRQRCNLSNRPDSLQMPRHIQKGWGRRHPLHSSDSFNYSSESKEITHNYPTSKELISGKTVKEGDHVTLPPWGVLIMEVY